MIVCAGKNETLRGAEPIGVGLVETAINLTKLYLEKKPKKIVFVGSAGSYGKVKIWQSIRSCKASNIEVGFLKGLCYTPIENVITSKNVSCETNIIVNSSNYITTDKNISHIYLEKGFDLENMEFYSVLNVAKKFDIECEGFFVVTNYCNENAHKTFIQNHNRAKIIMEKFIERYR